MRWRWERNQPRVLARRRQTTTGTLQKIPNAEPRPTAGLCSFRGSREPVTLELDPWRMVAREATRIAHRAGTTRKVSRWTRHLFSLRRYLRGCSVVPATLLAALSLVPMRVAARSVTDACFGTPQTARARRPRRRASRNNLIHSKQGRFMARVLVAYEDASSGRTTRRVVDHSPGRAIGARVLPRAGECYLSAQWMTKELQGCLSGDGAADPLVQELLDVSVNCLDKSTDKGQCDGMGSKCHWTDSLAEGVPSFCGPSQCTRRRLWWVSTAW